MKRKAIIVSVSGLKLSNKEKKLFKKEKPWGVILFKRNIEEIKQVKKLVYDIRKAMKDSKFPILIDEEGGTIIRLQKIINNQQFGQNYFGYLFDKDKELTLGLYKTYIDEISKILNYIGININTVPVLDVAFKNTHSIILKRAYSSNINIIRELGSICISRFKKNKILTVMKHIPGHGSSNLDSHLVLPVVKKTIKKLYNEDFKCFVNMNSDFAMTAHILFKNIDKINCATQSKKILTLIRKKLRFKGLIISDDISMKALKSDITINALRSLTAGCNLVLHCSGNYSETKKLLNKVPLIDNFTQKKTSQIYKFLS